MSEFWVIAGKQNDAVPVVGQVYEIRDSRKGMFVGRITSVRNYFADVEVISGKIRWASRGNQIFRPNPKVVGIRASLTYLIEVEESPE